MLRMPKTISALALGVALSAAFVMPAEALSLIPMKRRHKIQASAVIPHPPLLREPGKKPRLTDTPCRRPK